MRATVLVLCSVLLASTGQTMLKMGLDRSDSGTARGLLNFARLAFGSWYVWVGLTLFAVSVFIWMRVLSTSQLSWGYPLLGLSYVFVALSGWLVFGEQLSAWRIVGITMVIMGAILVGSSR